MSRTWGANATTGEYNGICVGAAIWEILRVFATQSRKEIKVQTTSMFKIQKNITRSFQMTLLNNREAEIIFPELLEPLFTRNGDLIFVWCSDYFVIASKEQEEEEFTWQLLLPFQTEVWICILVTVIGLALPVIQSASRSERSPFLGVLEAFFWKIFCEYRFSVNQGLLTSAFTSWSHRVTVIHLVTLLFAVTILTPCYTGIVSSYLTVNDPPHEIDTFDDLAAALHKGNVRTIGIPRFIYNDIRSKIHTGKLGEWLVSLEHVNLMTMAEVVRRHQEEKYVMLAATESLLSTRFHRRIYHSCQQFLDNPVTVVVSKGIPYFQDLKELISDLTETGHFYKWKSDCYWRYKVFDEREVEFHRTLKLKFYHQTLVALLVGLSMSVLVFIVEVIVSNCFRLL